MFRATLGYVGVRRSRSRTRSRTSTRSRSRSNIAKQGENSIQYRVTTAKDFRVIVDHFYKYPLISQI
jgi:hypothetical protein